MGSREKFVQLAEKRVTKALKDIHLIGNLSNKNNYEYTDVDSKKIIIALENAIKTVKKRFEEHSTEENTEFKL